MPNSITDQQPFLLQRRTIERHIVCPRCMGDYLEVVADQNNALTYTCRNDDSGCEYEADHATYMRDCEDAVINSFTPTLDPPMVGWTVVSTRLPCPYCSRNSLTSSIQNSSLLLRSSCDCGYVASDQEYRRDIDRVAATGRRPPLRRHGPGNRYGEIVMKPGYVPDCRTHKMKMYLMEGTYVCPVPGCRKKVKSL